MELEDLGEQLYNLLAQVLNRPENRAFFDSIRGEYGVLWYLLTKKEAVSAGELKEKLHVVPGRMTDILTALEKKGLIIRQKNKTDRGAETISNPLEEMLDGRRGERGIRRSSGAGPMAPGLGRSRICGGLSLLWSAIKKK